MIVKQLPSVSCYPLTAAFDLDVDTVVIVAELIKVWLASNSNQWEVSVHNVLTYLAAKFDAESTQLKSENAS